MIPILFDKGSSTFTSYGVGTLSDTITCVVTEERNGLFELEMTYPTTGIHFQEIQNSAIILAKPNEKQNPQAFRIYEITSPIDEVCTIKAEHISYQLKHIPIDCFEASSAADAFIKLKQYSLITNPFNFYTDKNILTTYINKEPKSARALLGGEANSFLQKFQGEYLWDNWNVSLLTARGMDNGVELRYGKNITNFDKNENLSDTVTGVCPYWKNEGSVLVGDITKVNTSLPYDRIETIDVSSDIETSDEGVFAPTKAQVTQAGAQHLQNKSYVNVPSTNIKISFVALWQTEEYKNIAPLERVGLCDTVTVIYEKYGISKKEKVIKTVYDVILERYNEIEIGDPHYTLATSFASVLSAVEDTNDKILLEVTRRKEGEAAADAKIELTAEEIKSTVAKSQREWDTTGYTINVYGYEMPTSDKYPPSEYAGKYFLNQANGAAYYCDGYSWSYYTSFQTIQASLESEISQTADQISLKVSKGDVSSQLSVESGQITLSSGRLVITAGNFTLDAAGNAAATNFVAKRWVQIDSGSSGYVYLGGGSGGKLVILSNVTATGGNGWSGSFGGVQCGDISCVGNIILDYGNHVYEYSSNHALQQYATQTWVSDNFASDLELSSVQTVAGNAYNNANTAIADAYNAQTQANNAYTLASNALTDVRGAGRESGTGKYFLHTLYDSSGTVYYTTMEIDTGSDRRLKVDIKPLDDFTDFYMELKVYKFKYNPKLEATRMRDYVHYGIMAQDTMELYDKYGIPSEDISLFYKEEADEVQKELTGEDTYWSMNRGELHALHIQMIQKQQRQIDAQQKEIDELKALVKELKEVVNANK